MRKYSVYAPVIIPTLCRYEHFKRCIESLSRCTGAEYTDVYIGLDYPAKEEHWDGYKKINEYLEHVSGFNNVIVSKREYNYGVSANIQDLKEQVRNKCDRYIFSEDDNEFAPNFLEYMNISLERYKDNPNVLRICGCLMPWGVDYEGCMKTYPYNAFPAMNFNAFGYGVWFSKLFKLPLTKDSILQSYKLTFKTFMYGYCLTINRFLYQLHKESQIPDLCLTLYCAFNHKYCIFPRISKVKNWGFDGTGLNSDDNHKWIDVQKLDTSATIELDDFEIKEYKEVKRFLRQMFDAPSGRSKIKMRWVVLKNYIFYRITGVRGQDIPQGERARTYILKKLFRKREL